MPEDKAQLLEWWFDIKPSKDSPTTVNFRVKGRDFGAAILSAKQDAAHNFGTNAYTVWVVQGGQLE